MDILHFVEEITRGAGDITLKYFNNATLRVDTKANDTPVTQADREAEQYLRAEIKKRFPNDGIIGEEFGVESGTSNVKWILDPLDGTKTFIHGVPFYGTLVAREEDDVVTHGAIYMPALSELVIAERGKGCFWNGVRCHASDAQSLQGASIMTTDYGRLLNLIGDTAMSSLLASAGLYRTWGDCYGHLLVATGRADIMLDAECAVWDIAPMAVIMEEAGATYQSFAGQKTIRGGDLITTNGHLALDVQALLAKSRVPS